MKHFVAPSVIAITFALALCSYAQPNGQAAPALDPTDVGIVDVAPQQGEFLTDDDQDSTEITGAFRYHGFDGEYIYFSLDGVPVRMLESQFPKVIPPNGTVMTATGCTKDADGGYTCTGLK